MRLVLIGGGHAHLSVLEAVIHDPWPGVEITLISPAGHHHYSGMVPGYLEGRYREPELRFDLVGLCRAAGARFVEGRAERVLPPAEGGEGIVEVDGVQLPFDTVSLDVGSAPVALELPGVVEHAFTIRPMSRAVELREALDRTLGAVPVGEVFPVAVVGAGAAGFEVALTLEARVAAAGRRPEIHLIEAGPRILPGFGERVRRRALSILARRGVTVRTDTEVTSVEAHLIHLKDRDPVPVRLTAWMTGAAPPPLLASSKLPLAPDGFLAVDARLRSIDGAPVWGAGDCISLEGHPEMPRAGVYAVRQGPVLARNLERAVQEGGEGDRYEPQESFLSLMNTGDGRALLRWGWVVAHAGWCFRLKDWIDRRFMRRYRTLLRDGE